MTREDARKGLIAFLHREYHAVNQRRVLGCMLARLDIIELHRKLCYLELVVEEAA